MIMSRYVNTVPIDKEPGTVVIINALSGAVDILDTEEAELLFLHKDNPEKLPETFQQALLERGYLFHSVNEENELLNSKYLEFIKLRDEGEVQFLLSMTYSCNMACTYCYQKNFDSPGVYITKEGIDNFFAFIKTVITQYPNKKYYVTLFGGEPFLAAGKNKPLLEYLLQRCREQGIKISVVTNGYELLDFADLLDKQDIKEIQVTLDGTAAIHNKRRPLKQAGSSFQRIIKGMRMLSEKRIPINLRVVLDRENIHSLPELVEYLEKEGFFNLPKNRFKTQIGRSYNLYSDLANSSTYSYYELHKEYIELLEEYPILKKFYEPNFKGIKYLVKRGKLAFPLFDGCPAFKSEWAFDALGNVYGCTASCGDKNYLTGSFLQGEIHLNKKEIDNWRSRSVMSIEKCQSCAYAFFCGGGCGVMASEHSGGLHQPDCKEIEKIIHLGINFYYNDIKKLSEQKAGHAA